MQRSAYSMIDTNNEFLREVENRFLSMRRYEDKNIQAKALNVMPVLLLEQRAQERMRMLQKDVKQGIVEDVNISIQEMLLLELLAWFKDSFFEWVDSPECDYCGSDTKFSHMSTDPKLLIATDRVEMHRCTRCSQFSTFPRYGNLEILLETREGRCGEWANVFTLFCRSLGWEARHVYDETDHVWTEVYSIVQKRWLHCDPCENVCDNPLMYESGWGKKLSYVIAYSHEEIQDVTWRYSSVHSKVLQNRTRCSETALVETIIKLRESRQRQLSPARRNYLTRRTLLELVELMIEKKPTDAEKQGRTSGDLAWRLGRGETRETVSENKVWLATSDDLQSGQMTIRYSASKNQYERLSVHGDVTEKVQKWENGVSNARQIFRKEEKDWKVVYLCRRESSPEGEIQWTFETGDSGKVIDKVHVIFKSEVFENGQVEVLIRGDTYFTSISNSSEICTEDFSGSRHIDVTARLKGGKGECAWQHAQIFRQSMASIEYPFYVNLTFKPNVQFHEKL